MDIDPKLLIGAVTLLAGGLAALHRALVAAHKTRNDELAREITRLQSESTERTEQLLACHNERREQEHEVSELIARLAARLRGDHDQ